MARLVLLVSIALLVACRSIPPDRGPPPVFPADASWRSVAVIRVEDEETSRDETVFVSRGEKWRLESGPVITVCDGKKVVTTITSGAMEPELLDVLGEYRRLYADLPRWNFQGEEEIDGRPCLKFTAAETARAQQMLWIDAETSIPRRHYVRIGDLSTDEQFFDMPPEFVARPELFDAGALEEALRKAAEEARSEESGPEEP